MKIFDDILIPAQVYVGRIIGIFKSFPVSASILPFRVIKDPIVDVSSLWDFVAGASQGWPQIGGVDHLKLSLSLGVDRLHIIGDSKLTMDCLKLDKPPWGIFILPI